MKCDTEGPPPEKFTLTAADVAERFGVCAETVRNAARAGLLRGTLVGAGRRQYWRFSEAAVRDYAARTQPAGGII